MTKDKDILYKVLLIKINRLEEKRIKAYNAKIECVKAQNYHNAGEFREIERCLLLEIDKSKKLMELNNTITNK